MKNLELLNFVLEYKDLYTPDSELLYKYAIDFLEDKDTNKKDLFTISEYDPEIWSGYQISKALIGLKKDENKLVYAQICKESTGTSWFSSAGLWHLWRYEPVVYYDRTNCPDKGKKKLDKQSLKKILSQIDPFLWTFDFSKTVQLA